MQFRTAVMLPRPQLVTYTCLHSLKGLDMRKLIIGLIVGVVSTASLAGEELEKAFLDKLEKIQQEIPDCCANAAYNTAITNLMWSVSAKNHEALAALGSALMRTRDYTNAKTLLLPAAIHFPQSAKIHVELALTSAFDGRQDCITAKWAYQKAKELDPEGFKKPLQDVKRMCKLPD